MVCSYRLQVIYYALNEIIGLFHYCATRVVSAFGNDSVITVIMVSPNKECVIRCEHGGPFVILKQCFLLDGSLFLNLSETSQLEAYLQDGYLSPSYWINQVQLYCLTKRNGNWNPGEDNIVLVCLPSISESQNCFTSFWQNIFVVFEIMCCQFW